MNQRTVPFAAPVMRQVARMELPSTRALMTCARRSGLSLFIAILCMTAYALSIGNGAIRRRMLTAGPARPDNEDSPRINLRGAK